MLSFTMRWFCMVGKAAYRSATCKVYGATDRLEDLKVALKIVYNSDHMQDEVLMRYNRGQPLNEDLVIAVLCVHVPQNERAEWKQAFSAVDEAREAEGKPSIVAEQPSPDGEYAIVLPWAERNLDQVMSSERMAANDLPRIMEVLEHVTKGLLYLHQQGLIHGDVKRKNVMRKVMAEQEESDLASKAEWLLIDMDAAVETGKQLGEKYSEAIIAPEYMKVLLPCRTNGRPSKGHPTIKAVCTTHHQPPSHHLAFRTHHLMCGPLGC